MTVAEGARLGDRYVLGRLLGRGGMADVYAASDEVLHRQVAVKVLRETSDDPSSQARFTAEGRTLAKLNHPSLVTVLDAGAAEDQPFLVLQLVDGPTLAEVLRSERLPLDRVARIGADLAAGLADVHRNGIVHRDVKPGNVLLAKDGRALLSDFGIARLLADTAHHTRTGLTIGTVAYLSPEQVRGEQVTPATDVYSLGLVLLEARSGSPVYEGTGMEAALARVHAPPGVPDDLPAPWRELLTAMVRLDPAARPAAADVASALEGLTSAEAPAPTRVLEVTPATTTTAGALLAPPAPAAPAAPPASPGAARPPWVLRAAVLVTAAVLVGLGVFALTDRYDAGDGRDIPPGVPAELRDPLAELHDAVEGQS